MGLFLFMEDDLNKEIDEQYEVFDLATEDNELVSRFKKALKTDVSHWNSDPFNYDEIDKKNIEYWLGNQIDETKLQGYNIPYIDNRLTPGARAVLAYVNNRQSQPDLIPSGGTIAAKNFANDMRNIMYQHGKDNKLKQKTKMATFNLVIRKRGFLKLRFDADAGPYGDIVVESIDPSDIIVDKTAKRFDIPKRIMHKQTCSIEELIAKFPKQKEKIEVSFKSKDDSSIVTYYEVWFTFYEDGKAREGLAWYLPKGDLILGKMKNPNWIYTGDDKKDKEVNYLSRPLKPFVPFNYMNTGRSYLDETCLFGQAIIQQDILNKRGRQIMENADLANGRVIVDADSMNEEDASNFLNKNPKSIMLLKTSENKSVASSVVIVPQTQLPAYVLTDKEDARNEIDHIMGAPSVFQGQESSNNTLGQDTQNIQQAGALQDDLAASIDDAMEEYYRQLFHMIKVYYVEDRLVQVKRDDGKYDYIMLKNDNIDTNAKISVVTNSTTPDNKQQVASSVIALAKLGPDRIDNLTLYEALNLPDPEGIAARVAKATSDPGTYMKDIEKEAFDRDADTDLTILQAGEEPNERDDYGQAYLEYFGKFIMSNKFTNLEQSVQEAIKIFIAKVGMKAARTVNLGATQTGGEQPVAPELPGQQPLPLDTPAPTPAPVPMV